jgi:hypothetical protein
MLAKVLPLCLAVIQCQKNNSIGGRKKPRWQEFADATIRIPNQRREESV